MAGNLKNNLEVIRRKIEEVKPAQNALPSPVIVAVSKKQPIDRIQELYGLGIKDFGENYVQESMEKMASLQALDIRWHYIGAIQSKKLKDIVGHFTLIHSVSREVELQKISQLSQEKGLTQKILVQLNIAKEDSKSGVMPENIFSFCQKAQETPGVELCGMMVFPPLEDSIEKTRAWFEESQKIYNQIGEKLPISSWEILSMGTSSDFATAYSCGATHLRIGENLMGPRPK